MNNPVAHHRLSVVSLFKQILLDTFLRCQLPLYTITWFSLVISFASFAIAMSDQGVTVAMAVEQINPIIYPVTFMIAGVLTIWGTWTRDAASAFPQRYFLLPVSSEVIFGMTLSAQLILSLLAIFVGILPAMIIGVEYQLAYSVPVFVAAVTFGMLVNWCRADLRFFGWGRLDRMDGLFIGKK